VARPTGGRQGDAASQAVFAATPGSCDPTVHQPTHPVHTLPWVVELLAVAVIGAAVLFGLILVTNGAALLPGEEAAPATPATLPYTQAD